MKVLAGLVRKICLRLLCKCMCRYLKICLWEIAAISSFFKKWPLNFDAVIEKINLTNVRIWQLVEHHINLDIGYDSIYLKVASLFSVFLHALSEMAFALYRILWINSVLQSTIRNYCTVNAQAHLFVFSCTWSFILIFIILPEFWKSCSWKQYTVCCASSVLKTVISIHYIIC